MSHIKTTLKELLRYYDRNRGVGHTFAALNGAKNTENCIVMTASKRDEERIWNESDCKCALASLNDLKTGALQGHTNPLVFDNFAITELARQSFVEIARLESKIQEMKNAVQAIADA